MTRNGGRWENNKREGATNKRRAENNKRGRGMTNEVPELTCLLSGPWVGARKCGQRESILRRKGLRDRNSPTCTLSQNGYGED